MNFSAVIYGALEVDLYEICTNGQKETCSFVQNDSFEKNEKICLTFLNLCGIIDKRTKRGRPRGVQIAH